MDVQNSAIATKIILMASLTASSAIYDHDIQPYMGSDSFPVSKNIEFSSINSSRFGDIVYNETATNTVLWNDKIKLGKEQAVVPHKFGIANNNQEVLEISKKLFDGSEILTGPLSDALINVIERVGKKTTDLPNRL